MNDHCTIRALVFDSLEQQIAVIDATGTIIDVNAAWTRFGAENGLSPEYGSIGSNYLEVIQHSCTTGDCHAAEAAQGILDVLNGQCAGFYHEYPCHSPDARRWFMMRVSALKGAFERLFVISHDNITERKLAEEHADYLALHDPLTELANRRYFNEFLGREMRKCIRDHSILSLVMIDVDHFKSYNDALGHGAGDLCLVKISQVLSEYARRPDDLAARIGGDEFAMILGETHITDAQTIADAVREKISDLKLVFGGSKQVTVSVGIASVSSTKQQLEESLLQEADKALYLAKSAGRDRVVLARFGIDKNGNC